MLALLLVLTLANTCLLCWLIRRTAGAQEVRGVIVANYVALRRLEKTAELMDDAVGVHREVMK